MSGKIIIIVKPDQSWSTDAVYGELPTVKAGDRLFWSPLCDGFTRGDVLRKFERWRPNHEGSPWTHWAAECMVIYPECFFVELVRPGRGRKAVPDMEKVKECIRYRLMGSMLGSEIRNRMRKYSPQVVDAALNELVGEGSVCPVTRGGAIRYRPSPKSYAEKIRTYCIGFPGGRDLLSVLDAFPGVEHEDLWSAVVFEGRRNNLFKVEKGRVIACKCNN